MSTLEDVCREHLTRKNCTLWGQAFDVKSETGLDRAVTWLAQQVREVISLRQERMEEEPLPEYKEDESDGAEEEAFTEHVSLAGV